VKIGVQGVVLKLHKFVNGFLKIENFPPSTCAQSALPMYMCREHNFYFPKMKNSEKGEPTSKKK